MAQLIRPSSTSLLKTRRADSAQANGWQQRPSSGCRYQGRATACEALPDWMKAVLDYDSWAPKSSRIWRLQTYEHPEQPTDDEVDELQAKISRLQSNSGTGGSGTDGSAAVASQIPGREAIQGELQPAELPITGSFADAGDSDLARAFSQRMQALSQESDAELEGEEEVEEIRQPVAVEAMTGQEMRDLMSAKWGYEYDLSFARRDIPGKAFVCLNVMWQHTGQRSFRMTEDQYMDKIESIAYMLNVLGQTLKVREFLGAPAKSQKGLPRRPVMGTAISIQLDLEPDVVKDFFGAGYQ
mmetsp:Transcript_21566/g.36736  ORF Transcript_21566/g.36736 Transcript_21566/m.36736 type:complete len:298 (+) Transcript_21566:38-931(+)|eukprot:CAMPEP_0119107406 /NCGR_PEP_ID=MMETSP1180-20130426/9855_1 /TAXON_ID=3052 ORGANISM="Chlamydomonas cf sp, Strain CCMP681" /NCGR_SAMPLE_ID=MMETSP1180 /ASSEMBLY_ACC=CAM_ASM_000741 /LENGTH=297 /DNA_ID=CAMNT_0007092887 /DNA_START=36 /DNA_END=929 /DNA_ORIENTATION=+